MSALVGSGVSTARGQPFDLAEYLAQRDRRLERENEVLRAERQRLERLLADALRVAVGGTIVSPLALFRALADMQGTATERPAYVEYRERRRTEARLDSVLKVLRETA